MKTYKVVADCESCAHEQTLTIELPENYSDVDLNQALLNSPTECTGCHDRAFVVSGDEPVLVEP